MEKQKRYRPDDVQFRVGKAERRGLLLGERDRKGRAGWRERKCSALYINMLQKMDKKQQSMRRGEKSSGSGEPQSPAVDC